MDLGLGPADCDANGPPGGQQVTGSKGGSWGEWRVAFLTKGKLVQLQIGVGLCFVKDMFFHLKIWNHPIETTIDKWMFRVPGIHI